MELLILLVVLLVFAVVMVYVGIAAGKRWDADFERVAHVERRRGRR